jgi:serine/threonine protein kinase
MAEVHLARTRGLGGFEKLLVVKRILPEFTDQTEYVQMLLDEARLVATLDHSNLVQVYDVGMEDGGVYFSMEFLHGVDVSALIAAERNAQSRVPVAQAATILLGVCAGLHHAHEKTGSGGEPLGIVHRDLSPHNVFVTFDGAVKVIDFGIAKANHRLVSTAHGKLKGKFRYMSPEQCRCDPLDRRSDVFSLGILAYEVTTSHRPFDGDDLETMRAILDRDPILPSKRVGDYPAALEAIVMKALRKDPAARYQSVAEMQRDLERYVQSQHLGCTQFALAQYMETRFAADLQAWRAAERSGISMAEFLVSHRSKRDRFAMTPSTSTPLPAPTPIAQPVSIAPEPLLSTNGPAPVGGASHTEPRLRRSRIAWAAALAVSGIALGAWALTKHTGSAVPERVEGGPIASAAATRAEPAPPAVAPTQSPTPLVTAQASGSERVDANATPPASAAAPRRASPTLSGRRATVPVKPSTKLADPEGIVPR